MSEYLFGQNCHPCGMVTCYADDATAVIGDRLRDNIQLRLDEVLNKLKRFLNSHHLVINESKTCLVETMIKQKKGRARGVQPTLRHWRDRRRGDTRSCH